MIGSKCLAALVPAVLAVTPALADCTCRWKAVVHPLGGVVCDSRNGQPVLLQCRMNQNITSWDVVGDGCPSAALPAFRHEVAETAHLHGPVSAAVYFAAVDAMTAAKR